jgi:alkanesulfonate monooxygenase SsuD/methylene tetrahydromethanopterin reductase-like flavin-dependent oxidoreductase (luciferase family)
VFPYGFEGRGVPEQYHQQISTIVEQYVHSQHGSLAAPHVALLTDPALTDYLARRFAIVGTPDEFADQVRELASRGVTQIRLGVGAPGADVRDQHLQTIVQKIMPRVG